jgi:hypothetical protein
MSAIRIDALSLIYYRCMGALHEAETGNGSSVIGIPSIKHLATRFFVLWLIKGNVGGRSNANGGDGMDGSMGMVRGRTAGMEWR